MCHIVWHYLNMWCGHIQACLLWWFFQCVKIAKWGQDCPAGQWYLWVQAYAPIHWVTSAGGCAKSGSHVQHATDLALCISGKLQRPVPLQWLPLHISHLHSAQNHEEYLVDDTKDDEWEDVPSLDPSQEMLADVITEDSTDELSIDSVWDLSVSNFMKYYQSQLTCCYV